MSDIPTKDGIYDGVPEEVYHKIPRLSSSAMGALDRSPAHLLAYIKQTIDSTADHFVVGGALHSAVLTPGVFKKAYARAPEGDRRKKEVKEAVEALVKKHGAAYVVRAGDYDNVVKLAAAAQEHPVVGAILAMPGRSEVTILWTDAATGIELKGRVDWLPDDPGWFFDLKTTTDARTKPMSKSMYAYGYHRQMALYRHGLATLGEPRAEAAIIAMEKEDPFAMCTYRVDEGAMSAGDNEWRRLLDLYAECSRTGDWPGYTEGIVDLTLPPWAWSEIENKGEGL